MSHQIETLSPMQFPASSAFKRDPFFAPEARFEDFAEKYDDRTLFYQAIGEENQIRLMAPKLLNFEALLRKGQFRVDGAVAPIKSIRKYRRHAEILLTQPNQGTSLHFEIDGLALEARIMPSDHALKGQNLILTRQKNNPLDWVHVWASHHVKNQGVTAVVIVDNGSTDYTLNALSQTLANVDGLEHSLVIDAPFLFGPIAKDRPRNRGLFYQAAMLNLVKHGFAKSANAVMCCVDIDELVHSDDDRTIFEALEKSRLGYVQIPGHWRYAKEFEDGTPKHSDHVLASKKRDHSKEKYCVKINGPLGHLPWDIHNIGRGRFNKFFYSKSHSFYHCEQLSTSWIVNRKEPSVNDLSYDQDTAEFFTTKIKPLEG